MNFLKSISIERGGYSSFIAIFLVLELFIALSAVILVLIGIIQPFFTTTQDLFGREEVFFEIFILRIETNWIPLNSWSSFMMRPIQILAYAMIFPSSSVAGIFFIISFYQLIEETIVFLIDKHVQHLFDHYQQ